MPFPGRGGGAGGDCHETSFELVTFPRSSTECNEESKIRELDPGSTDLSRKQQHQALQRKAKTVMDDETLTQRSTRADPSKQGFSTVDTYRLSDSPEPLDSDVEEFSFPVRVSMTSEESLGMRPLQQQGGKRQQESRPIGLSQLEIILLTLCLAGVQFTWTVELGYGTPYLLELGMREEVTALVWLAGPLSGIIFDMLVIGSTFDIPFSYVVGAVLVTVSIIMIAYSKEIATTFFMIFENVGDKEAVSSFTISVAVVAFYILDFSINAVQACCRALVVDVAPISQQDDANAWAGRMIGFGNVAGYFLGYVNLPRLFPFFGETQLQVLCIIAILWFLTTITVTCASVQEVRLESPHNLDRQKGSLEVRQSDAVY
ncbi:hypothetical protein HK102_001824 [Quaeritorhiza haematococci]|nr:hypothetical protein HK102_001824 [Quaeritorhiza haematococci]